MSSAPPPPAPPRRDWRNMTRTLAHYERIEQIGEGTYGQVYRAKCLDTGRIVALKKIRVHHGGYWGMPPTVIREIKILKKLQHPNLVEMLEVVSSKGVQHLEQGDNNNNNNDNDEASQPRQSKNSSSTTSNRIVDAREGYKGNIYLVLEYVSHDLTGLMDVAYRFTEQQIKCIFQQLLQALQYMHNQKFIHRDIKSSNILIDSHFCVKLADFGLSRSIEPPILESIHE
jgi:serine/threonine protein kinase